MGKPHRKWYNENTYEFKCDGCRKAFQTNNALQQHNTDKQGVHTPRVRHMTRPSRRRKSRSSGLGAYQCSNCLKKFASNKALEQHSTAVNGRCSSELRASQSIHISNVSTIMAHFASEWIPAIPSNSFLNNPYTAENSLNKLAVSKLQPTEEFNNECSRDIDMLATFLKSNVNGVAEVLVSGSLKKGTAIQNNVDLDVVVFLNRFADMDDFRRKINGVIVELRDAIKGYRQREFVEIEGKTRSALKLKLRTKLRDEFIDVDLLPARNNLETPGRDAVYQEMNGKSSSDREYYSSSLAPLQLKFVRDRVKDYPNAKNLIRLVKHWRKTHFPLKQAGSLKFPTSYVLELITIHCWEKAGGPQSFNMETAFKTVMKCIADYKNLNIIWPDNYRQGRYSNMAIKEFGRPCVLDPANPFNNVCLRFMSSWENVAELARLSANTPLLYSFTSNEHDWSR